MTLPETMTAVEITEPGGPDVLKTTERPVPVAGPGQVLIQVSAAGVNRPDVSQRAGAYPPPPGASDLPGLEVAGTVAALGSGVGALAEGDVVCALTAGGGYAEYCVAHAEHCLPLPKGYDMVRAAALPENYFTVWSNVFGRGRLANGETFLVHGGSSGIGTTSIQLAHAFGAKVVTTAGSAKKCKVCKDLGADLAINYREEDWPALAAEFAGKDGVDVILDMVGGDYIGKNLRLLAVDGRYVMIAFLGGSKAEVDFVHLMMRRQTITGSTLRPQSDAAKAAIAGDLRREVWPLLDAGTVKPIIHRTFPLGEAAAAHKLMESSAHIGKIVLEMP